ncbi:hypothetical protein AVEN_35409-1 [Araneus ventricosus]|uniref:Uncharacterized protein n=1 Tax=Araneus ventricosus TaxID=182803 RepID=A0A4Y2N9P6_ARAVE|nr:hypothetical protein AVEN_35409-1 [Araneus ventricosus]
MVWYGPSVNVEDVSTTQCPECAYHSMFRVCTPLDVQNLHTIGYSTGCPECVQHWILHWMSRMCTILDTPLDVQNACLHPLDNKNVHSMSQSGTQMSEYT